MKQLRPTRHLFAKVYGRSNMLMQNSEITSATCSIPQGSQKPSRVFNALLTRVGADMTFYSDFLRKTGPIHTVLICLSHAYMEYSDSGYVRTVDYANVVWC